MTDTKSRIVHELEHGRMLATEGAESIWNWASPTGIKRADRRANYFVKLGRIRSQDKVLEIGCGTGLFTRKVAAMSGAQITAIDVSEELLKIARENTVASQATYRIEDAMNMSFPDNTFDVIFGSSVLHHLEFEKSLSELLRVLKPGGRIVFAEPNMLNPQILIQKNVPFIKKMLGDSPDESAIIRWKLAKQMRRIGYVHVHISPYDFLHPLTPRSLVNVVDKISAVLDKVPLLREIAGSVVIYGEKKL